MSGPTRIRRVGSFAELLKTPFTGEVNALCWERALPGDFAEVARLLGPGEGIESIEEGRLHALPISPAGREACEQMLADLKLLQAHDLAPLLNCVHDCTWSPEGGVVPTDVLSFHVDSAPIEVDTWLCTYFGAGSEGLLNEEAVRKIDSPPIRAALLKEYDGPDDADFAAWLHEHCFDRHYAPKPDATPYPFGIFNLWRISNEWPGHPVPPCIHRAPLTHVGTPRLLLIS